MMKLPNPRQAASPRVEQFGVRQCALRARIRNASIPGGISGSAKNCYLWKSAARETFGGAILGLSSLPAAGWRSWSVQKKERAR
jgi:hypothetical protein